MASDDYPFWGTLVPSLNIIPPNTPSDLFSSAFNHFNGIPWTASLLNQPNVVHFVLGARNPVNPQVDQLFGSTLNNERAIPHMLSFYTAPQNPDDPITKVSTLYQLGHGITGGPGILHGGMTMSMVDEGMASLTEINTRLGKKGDAFTGYSVTGTLEIKFLAPIYTGTAVIVTAWMEGTERRKTTVRCEVKDENGKDLARCSSIWVSKKPHL